MAANFAISLVGRPTQVSRPRSCAPAAVSVTAPPYGEHKVSESLRPNRSPSGESRSKSVKAEGDFSKGADFCAWVLR